MIAVGEQGLCRLELDTLSAFALLGALRLVLRHPLLNEESEGILRGIAVDLQEALPRELGEMANLGWNPDFERPVMEA